MGPLAGRQDFVEGVHASWVVWGVRDRRRPAAPFIGQLGRASKGAGLVAGGRDLLAGHVMMHLISYKYKELTIELLNKLLH